MAISTIQPKRIGIGYWMEQVLTQLDELAGGFRPDPIHDLRTALRRCRSMADGIMVFDADSSWKKMKRAGKQLFESLGALRDSHVLKEWVEKLAPEDDATAHVLRQFLENREKQEEIVVAASLQQFDRNKWKAWTQQLPPRSARIPLDSPLFAHLALERWHEAHVLHRQALRNRTNVAFHTLRIGIKRFRYTVENFLPSLHEFWSEDLKDLQDALGDVHDLDVLWATALGVHAFTNEAAKQEWRSRIQEKRHEMLQKYREKMLGRDSFWAMWRSGLPKPEQLRPLGLKRLGVWASFLDPDAAHSRHVEHLAVRIWDGLPDPIATTHRERYRTILQAAALMHDVGRSKTNKGHHKASARLIRKLKPPLGWNADDLRLAALVARYHRGALPSGAQKRFAALPQSKRQLVQFLAGILRLACACDSEHDTHIRGLEVESSTPVLRLRAEGYTEATALAEHIAAARHLLEIACERPVFMIPAA